MALLGRFRFPCDFRFMGLEGVDLLPAGSSERLGSSEKGTRRRIAIADPRSHCLRHLSRA
jgi:hypothetical protein